MSENENIVVEESAEPQKGSFGAKAKEWLRKKIVALKRRPQMIPLFVLLVSSVFFMFALYPLSEATYQIRDYPECQYAGLCLFITTLLSLLVLVSFLNAFPKRKKPNIVFICLVYAMVAAMIGFNLWNYFQVKFTIATQVTAEETIAIASKGQPFLIVHIIMLGIFTVIFALLPVIKILVNKINTSVTLESATENMKEIDIQED